MNKQRFFTFIFLLIYTVDNCAMQEEKNCTKIIGNITFPEQLSAIMCTTPGKVDILHSSHYTSWDYTTHESATSCSNVYATKSEIYFHPRANKIFLIAETKNACYADRSAASKIKGFLGIFYSGLFSPQEPVLYMAGKEYFHHYDYEKDILSSLRCKTELGTLFTCPSQQPRRSYFLCSDRLNKMMYKIILTEKNARFTMQKIKIKKLFDFPFDVDLSSWVYSAREKLFFFINKYDRRMYCFNIKNIKKQDVQYKMYVKNNGFPVSAMKLHSNGRVLILLSEERDIIEYVDIKKYNSIRHLKTTIHEPLGRDKYIAQKMALSCEGDVLLLVAGRTCYAIEIPIEIREISFLEKSIMKMVCEQSGISKDIRKLIWYFLINLLKKEYVPSDTSPIKHHEIK